MDPGDAEAVLAIYAEGIATGNATVRCTPEPWVREHPDGVGGPTVQRWWTVRPPTITEVMSSGEAANTTAAR